MGEKEYMQGIRFWESPFLPQKLMCPVQKYKKHCSEFHYVGVAWTIFFKESLPQLMKKTVVFIYWVSKTFLYTVVVAI